MVIGLLVKYTVYMSSVGKIHAIQHGVGKVCNRDIILNNILKG